MAGRKVWAADEILAAADLQSYIQDQVVFVYANSSARASGILSPTEGMISYLQDTNALEMFDGSSWVNVLPNTGTAGTYTKVTTDVKGRVTSGTGLIESDIPALSASKVTSGTFDAARIPALDGSKITSGSITIPGNVTATNVTAANGTGEVSAGTVKIRNSGGTETISLGGATIATSGGTLTVSGNLNVGFNITSTGGYNISTSAYLVGEGGIKSSAVYNQTLSGTYKSVWVDANGYLGIGSSTVRVKQDIEPTEFDADAVLKLVPVNYRYIKDVEAVGVDAPVQIGLIAEDLVDAGLGEFVWFDDDGLPGGIHYERLAVALIPQLKKQAEKLQLLEDRLVKLESK